MEKLSRLTLVTIPLLCMLVLAGCKRAEEPRASSGETGTSIAAKTIEPTQAALSINVGSHVPNCKEGGQFQPITLPDNIGFAWTPVTQPPATRYAVLFTKLPPGATTPLVITERTIKASDELKVQSGERVTGVSYKVRVVAYDDKGPVCIVDGINGLSPLPN
jgi:hypothetical protein